MGTKDDLIKVLTGNSTVKPRKACLAAARAGDYAFCDPLLEALQIEANSRSWQTRVEIIKAIGVLGCSKAQDLVRKIALDPQPVYDPVKRVSATAYARLTRTSLSDIRPVMELIESGSYSAVVGALEAMGYDRMVPSDSECDAVIEKMWDYGCDRPKGYTDPRYGLAAACGGWKSSKVNAFLNHCLHANDSPLEYNGTNLSIFGFRGSLFLFPPLKRILA